MKHGEVRFETLGRSTSRMSRAISCTNTENQNPSAKEGYTSDHRNDLESREGIFINPSIADYSKFMARKWLAGAISADEMLLRVSRSLSIDVTRNQLLS